ncbi:CLUMA_CG007882, isoform C [Clunio marinus]|uniref:CLUMA_CG007882, isoform C n=1 Tax=Clunio marinus TaxID=568069 RepID=A0A1J1I2D2_9DIPT|nr:CLUMA_CG007882, isoform C [Clunio marinus]
MAEAGKLFSVFVFLRLIQFSIRISTLKSSRSKHETINNKSILQITMFVAQSQTQINISNENLLKAQTKNNNNFYHQLD